MLLNVAYMPAFSTKILALQMYFNQGKGNNIPSCSSEFVVSD